jgi:hypothetical protein
MPESSGFNVLDTGLRRYDGLRWNGENGRDNLKCLDKQASFPGKNTGLNCTFLNISILTNNYIMVYKYLI